MSSNSLVNLLEKAVSPDVQERRQVEEFIQRAAQDNWEELLFSLSEILVNDHNSDISRQLAGVCLKNHLTSTNPSVLLGRQLRWSTIDATKRHRIKDYLLNTLGTENQKHSAAAQVISSIASIEIPTNNWPDLMEHLYMKASSASNSNELKIAAFEVIKYISSDIPFRYLQKYLKDILRAVIIGIRTEQNHVDVKSAAVDALLKLIVLVQDNFEVETELPEVITAIFEAIKLTDLNICSVGLDCLVEIFPMNCKHLLSHMEEIIQITFVAMKSSVDEICVRGLEFWIFILENEPDFLLSLKQNTRSGELCNQSPFENLLENLIGELLNILIDRDINSEDENFEPSRASISCLELLSVKNDVLQFMGPFIMTNISNAYWKFKYAALEAFATTLESEDTCKLVELVNEILPISVHLLQDENQTVRKTAAWVVYKTFQMLPFPIFDEKIILELIPIMIICLEKEESVASKICWALSSLSQSAFEAQSLICEGTGDIVPTIPLTYCLSATYEEIVYKLLDIAERNSSTEESLTSAAYDAVAEMIQSSPKDCYETVTKVFHFVFDQINTFLRTKGEVRSSDGTTHFVEVHSGIFEILKDIIERFDEDDLQSNADYLMTCLLIMLRNYNEAPDMLVGVITTIGIFAAVTKNGFLKYFDDFEPLFFSNLQNKEHYKVCLAAIDTLELVMKTFVEKKSFCDNIMNVLLNNMTDAEVNENVKLQICSELCFIGKALGSDFRKYMPVVIETIHQMITLSRDFSIKFECWREIRNECMKTLTGTILSCYSSNNSEQDQLQFGHIELMFRSIEVVTNEPYLEDEIIQSCVVLIQAMCCCFRNCYGNLLKDLSKENLGLEKLFRLAFASKVSLTRECAQKCVQQICQLTELQ